MRKKRYAGREKFRCVLTILFDPMAGYQAQRDRLSRFGLTEPEIEAQVGDSPSPMSPVAKIARALLYTFDPSRRGSYVPLRFNTKEFPALYTAGSKGTAHIERRHHWKPTEHNRVSYFTVRYTGEARDLREEIALDALVFPDSYPDCQELAVEAIANSTTGIVAPSKRDPHGSCCALFKAAAVEPGDELRESTF
ncbi:RES family NAD+ phosphorylase [Mesorhizobium sp. CO1-1-8]|uniref:RES family NAD+ phosphorylase n=1 Tax=Mesorhizobium sp. CO1-1-8 TaxID=2876631 RepID=UPI001CD11065|nr:RES family NAD+ phosphorylase [Mesorhizobium sp. CO1-1-8]MBZ9772590.1 RES family NAD+ phosphorylase [Mesorhizobium sp. CO1-1-8]